MQLNWSQLRDFYKAELFERVLPFWVRLLDEEQGGLNNCVTDAGEVLATDKYLWSQGRALWVFSTLYSEFGRDNRWLGAAHTVARVILENAPAPGEPWPFKLAAEGTVLQGPSSIYVDAFVAYGCAAYYRATGEERAAEIARSIFRRTSPLLEDHSLFPTEPHPIPEGLQAHGPLMIFALVYYDQGRILGAGEPLRRALQLAEKIMGEHLDREEELLHEFVLPGGGRSTTPAGQTLVPGHVIESMWFLDRIYTYFDLPERRELTREVIRWHLEKGWDGEWGGLFLARHAGGGEAAWHAPEAKVWWAHTESLYALLRCEEYRAEPWCGEWYRRVHEYSFSHFPNREHGDWYQNLNRQGERIPVVVRGLQVKDPFHLPRALMYCLQVLERLAAKDRKGTFADAMSSDT